MTTSAPTNTLVEVAVQPLSSVIQFDSSGEPYLQGFRCSQCGAVLLETRRGCPQCAAVGSLQKTRLADHGKVFSHTIVHRSFPGIKTPFVSAVVELDDGGFIRGNLEGIDPTPAAVGFNRRVRVQFEKIAGHDKTKPALLRYVFVPLGELP